MTVLIIGTTDDLPSMHIRGLVQKRGVKTAMFDTLQYPRTTRITYATDGSKEGFFQEDARAPKIPLSEIRGVYRRWSKGIWAPQEKDPVLSEILYWNNESAVNTFMRCLPHAKWVNTAEATDMHKYKGYQLQILAEHGIRFPKTLITNDPDTVKAFYEEWKGRCIAKPVRGWAHTMQLDSDMLAKENLEKITLTPITLQERIDGTDIRIYVAGTDIFAMEILSDTLDFREQTDAPRNPVTLPPEVQETCLKINRLLGCVFTGIDCRRTPEGEYVFFEANPTPVFLLDEKVSGYPIGERLVDLLLEEKP